MSLYKIITTELFFKKRFYHTSNDVRLAFSNNQSINQSRLSNWNYTNTGSEQ